MLSAGVLAAAVTFLVVVIAGGIGVKGQAAGGQLFCCSQGIAGDAGIELNAGLGQSHPGAGADAAADELLHAETMQEASQGAMAAAQHRYHFRADHLAVFSFCHQELAAVSEMSEYLSVFIGYCYFDS